MSVPSEQREPGTSLSPEEIHAGRKRVAARSRNWVEATGLNKIHDIGEFAQRVASQRVEALVADYERGDIAKFYEALQSEPALMSALKESRSLVEKVQRVASKHAEALVADYERNGDIVKFNEALRSDPTAMDELKKTPPLVEQVQRLIRESGLADGGRQAAVPSEPRLEPPSRDERAAVPRPRRGLESSSIDR